MSGKKRQEEENQSSITRRRVLGSVGSTVGAIAGFGFVDITSAESIDIDEIQNSKEVQTLLGTVGNPEITNKNMAIHNIRGVKFLNANLEAEFGTVVYLKVLDLNSESPDKNHTSTRFEIKNLTREEQKKLPAQFDSTPVGVDISIRNKDGRTSFVSTVSEKERKQLTEIVGEKDFTTRYANNYYHIITTDGTRYKISSEADRPNIEGPSVETLVDTQLNEDACLDCVTQTTLSECATCVEPCEPTLNHGDPASCLHCILDKCRDADIIPCGKCIASIPGDYLPG